MGVGCSSAVLPFELKVIHGSCGSCEHGTIEVDTDHAGVIEGMRGTEKDVMVVVMITASVWVRVRARARVRARVRVRVEVRTRHHVHLGCTGRCHVCHGTGSGLAPRHVTLTLILDASTESLATVCAWINVRPTQQVVST